MQKLEITGYLPNEKKSHKSRHLIRQPLGEVIKLNATGLLVVSNMLKGTNSNEWLHLAEKLTYNMIKKQNGD